MKDNFTNALQLLASEGRIDDIADLVSSDSQQKELINQALVDGIRACGEKGKILEIAGFFEARGKRLRVAPLAQIEPALLEGINVSVKGGEVDKIACLACNGSLSESVRSQIEPAILEAIRVYKGIDRTWDCRFIENERMVNVFSDTVLVDAIRVNAEKGSYNHVSKLLSQEGLSDIVMLEVIKACGSGGYIEQLATLNERKGLSKTLKAQIRTSLLEGIPVCENAEPVLPEARFDRIFSVANLLGNKGLGKEIRIKVTSALLKEIAGCEKEGKVSKLIELLKYKNLGKEVKKQAESALIKVMSDFEKDRPPSDKDIREIRELLDRDYHSGLSNRLKSAARKIVPEDPKTVAKRLLISNPLAREGETIDAPKFAKRPVSHPQLQGAVKAKNPST